MDLPTNRFAPALRRVARELDVPRTVRAAIVLEMAADLESLYAYHRSRGAGEAEAIERAEEMVLGSAEVVRRLGRIHARPWRDWSEGVGSRLTGGAGLLLLVGGVVPVLVLSVGAAARVLISATGPLVWPLTGIGLAIIVTIALEVGRMIGGGRGGTAGLPLLLVLAAVAPAVGLLAVTLSGYQAAQLLATGTLDAAAQLAVVTQVGRDGALLLVGLLLGICAALSWFVLLSRASVRAAREVDALLEGASDAEHPGNPDGILPLVRGRRA